MPRAKPPIHGRDHRLGGADPIDFTGFIRYVLAGQTGLWLDIQTTGQDAGDWGMHFDVQNADARWDVEQTLWLVVNALEIASTAGISIADATFIDLQAPTIQALSGNIEEKITSGAGTRRWRVADSSGASILEILESGSISAKTHKIHDVVDPTAAQDAATKNYVDSAVGGASVTSVFGRTGAVVAVTGDYAGVVASFLTGATAASRYVGATTSGAPVSGTFSVGDFVVARDGHLFVCTTGGSPGTWTDVGTGASFATPSIALGSSAAAGSAGTVIRSDATIAAFDTTAPSTQAMGDAAAVGTAAFAARRDHKHAMPSSVTEAQITLATANTTNDVTITKHGFVPIAPNDTAKFLRGDGTWNTASLPSGSAAVATDAIWDTKGDLAAATGSDAAVKVAVGANGTFLAADSSASAGVAWQPGANVLLYAYTVTGSSKTTIDTAVDTPSAGIAGTSAFPSIYRMLEIIITVRSTASAVTDSIAITFNNDGAAHYDRTLLNCTNTTVTGSATTAASAMNCTIAAASCTAGVFSPLRATVPMYAGTVAHKVMELTGGIPDQTNANTRTYSNTFHWRDTSAITRIAFAASNLDIGTTVLIYAR